MSLWCCSLRAISDRYNGSWAVCPHSKLKLRINKFPSLSRRGGRNIARAKHPNSCSNGRTVHFTRKRSFEKISCILLPDPCQAIARRSCVLHLQRVREWRVAHPWGRTPNAILQPRIALRKEVTLTPACSWQGSN